MSVTEFPHIWLRDNDIAELHPTTRERTFDLTTVPIDILPADVRIEDNSLVLRWPNRDIDSRYAAEWLHRHRPGVPRQDPAATEQTLWNAESMTGIPRFPAPDCGESAAVLFHALQKLKRTGLIIVDQLADDVAAGELFGDLIGFKRQTNFGVVFDVVSKPDPNNLAYTSDALPLHIDLTNQELVPGYQFLHCIVNDAKGGESVFADGYQVCADLQQSNPEFFDTLKKIKIPCRFHDETCDIRQRRPAISQSADGQFTQLVFNAHIADVPDMDADTLCDFYDAYQALMRLARRAEYSVRYALQPGEMVVFDNRRVMHGRDAFNPATGERHLRGYYIDQNEVDSRIRMLHRERQR